MSVRTIWQYGQADITLKVWCKIMGKQSNFNFLVYVINYGLQQ